MILKYPESSATSFILLMQESDNNIASCNELVSLSDWKIVDVLKYFPCITQLFMVVDVSEKYSLNIYKDFLEKVVGNYKFARLLIN